MKLIFLHPLARLLSKYQTRYSVGLDIVACLDAPIGLPPDAVSLIPSGLSVRLPKSYEAQIRSRSGCSMKGLIVLNAPGTIDSDYTGEVKVIMKNTSQSTIIVQPGDRIAQMVVCKIKRFRFRAKNVVRKDAGFGSTGYNDMRSNDGKPDDRNSDDRNSDDRNFDESGLMLDVGILSNNDVACHDVARHDDDGLLKPGTSITDTLQILNRERCSITNIIIVLFSNLMACFFIIAGIRAIIKSQRFSFNIANSSSDK